MTLLLLLQAKELKIPSQSDELVEAKVGLYTLLDQHYEILGITEKQSLSSATKIVRWENGIVVPLDPDNTQEVIIRLYSFPRGRESSSVSGADRGEVRFFLSALLSSSNLFLEKPIYRLYSSQSEGKLLIRATESSLLSPLPQQIASRQILTCHIRIKNYVFPPSPSNSQETKQRLFFLAISRSDENSAWKIYWRSRAISPYTLGSRLDFSEQKIALIGYSAADDYRVPIRFSLWEEEEEGKGSPRIERAYVITTIQQIFDERAAVFSLSVISPSESSGKSISRLSRTADLIIENPVKERYQSYLSELIGDDNNSNNNTRKLDFSASIGIDFTKSNGRRTSPSSFHHISKKGRLNPYQKSLEFIHGIFESSSISNVSFKLYGMGAVFDYQSWRREQKKKTFFDPDEDDTPQPFDQLLLHSAQARLVSVSDLFQSYAKILPRLTFAGPSNYAPLLKAVRSTVASSNKNESYRVLFIVTDGLVSDFEATIQEIVYCSTLPLSIVFLGIGDGGKYRFHNLRLLESSTAIFVQNPKITIPDNFSAFRPIVQFHIVNELLALSEAALIEKKKDIITKITEQYVLWFQGDYHH